MIVSIVSKTFLFKKLKRTFLNISLINMNQITYDGLNGFYVGKVVPHAVVPTRATKGAAGYDLSACEDAVIPARGWKMVDTGIALQIPSFVYARVAPRSGLTLKKGLDVGAGVVDSDYRDSIRVILFNHSDVDFEVKTGDRIAQLIFEHVHTPPLLLVDYMEMANTERGLGGFGSTGV
jgi:dUTP pyrophosphatase